MTPKDQHLLNTEIIVNANLLYHFTMNFEDRINYANSNFCKLIGYEEYEIVDESTDMFTHPDVPDVFFEWYLEQLLCEESMRVATKLITKNGSYLWMFLEFTKKIDKKTNTLSYDVIGKKIAPKSIEKISYLFSILSSIEKKSGGIKSSRYYLIGLMEDLGVDYNGFVDKVIVIENEEPINTEISKATQKKDVPLSKEIKENSIKQVNKISYNPDMDIYRDY